MSRYDPMTKVNTYATWYKVASFPKELFMPTLDRIWRLKWEAEVTKILVIITVIIGGQFLLGSFAIEKNFGEIS